MAVDLSRYFQEKDEKLYFVGNYMEVYLPRFYFDTGIASQIGSNIEAFGVFNFRIYSSEEKKENTMLHTFKFPSPILLCPSSTSNEKDLKLISEIEGSSEYTILKFYKGDMFIANLNIKRDVDNVEKFLKLLNNGKLPNTLAYDEILELWFTNLDINNMSLNVPSTAMELVISEVYRDKNDLSKSFRYKAGSGGKVSMYDYKAVNLKAISNYNSTFTAITFEDIDLAITNSVNKTRYNIKEVESPIEKTIKY